MTDDQYNVPEGVVSRSLRWWNPLDASGSARLQKVLDSWVGTPYQEGQRARGIAVDCVQLCPGVMDALYKALKPTFVPRLQVDAAMHDIKRGWATVKAVREMHLGSEIADDGTVQPGDILLTRAEDHPSAPHRAAHAVIAGVKPWTGIHALPITGVCWTSIHPDRMPIIQIMRHRGKDQWAM